MPGGQAARSGLRAQGLATTTGKSLLTQTDSQAGSTTGGFLNQSNVLKGINPHAAVTFARHCIHQFAQLKTNVPVLGPLGMLMPAGGSQRTQLLRCLVLSPCCRWDKSRHKEPK